jgi:hypothetical protein
MTRISTRSFVLLASIVPLISGCCQLTYVTGYSTGDPIVRNQSSASSGPSWPVKSWGSDSLHTGWEVQGMLGKECDTQVAASCRSDGSWAITDHIINRAQAHDFQTVIEFGHVDNHDFRTFTVITTQRTSWITVGKNQDKVSSADGSQDLSLLADFNQINAVRPSVVIRDGIQFPLCFTTATQLTCTPAQPDK